VGRKKQAEQIQKSIEREGRAVVEDVSIKTVQEQSPLLFDLTELQKEANRKVGLSADEVLQTAQSLYEKHSLLIPEPAANIFLKIYGLIFLNWSEYSIKPIHSKPPYLL
jgi:exonuclease I